MSGSLETIATVAMITGMFVVTVAVNVPLNDELAAVDPASVAGAEVWARYLSRWTAWNSVRTLSSTASVVLLVTYLIRR